MHNQIHLTAMRDTDTGRLRYVAEMDAAFYDVTVKDRRQMTTSHKFYEYIQGSFVGPGGPWYVRGRKDTTSYAKTTPDAIRIR